MKEKLNYPDNKRISLEEAKKFTEKGRAISWEKAQGMIIEIQKRRDNIKRI